MRRGRESQFRGGSGNLRLVYDGLAKIYFHGGSGGVERVIATLAAAKFAGDERRGSSPLE